jgi:hypothetical protein
MTVKCFWFVIGVLSLFVGETVWAETAVLWKSGHGSGSKTQMLGDANGDGKADAIVFFDATDFAGKWYVDLNNGGTSCWQEGHGSGSNNQLVADVNGNGKVDAVAYFSTGNWYIAYSNGSKFGDYSTWKTGHGNGSKTRFLGDVNGDGKADAVAFFDAGGDFVGAWYVSLSGSSANSCWRTGHGANSTSQMLGDVNGDGKADAVTYFHNITVSNVAYTGAWFVAISNGSGFNNYTMATSGHGNGSGKQFLGDVNGDGKADAIVYFSSGT